MKSLWISLVLVAAFSVAGNFPIYAQSPEQLYQKGLMKEEGEGALQDAIDLYSQIADDGNADQSLRAKAMLHIGMCYEKMGTQEAVKSYQRLVSSFPNQKNEVAIAKERLNRLLLVAEKTPEKLPTPKFRKIEIPTELSWTVKLSPDGKNLLMGSDKKLWSLPLEGNLGPDFSGAPVLINTDSTEVDWSGLFWSYDDKWIAFNEYPETTDSLVNQWICIVPSGGGKSKKVFKPYRGPRIVNYQISISPDAKKLAFSSVKDDEQYIYIIPVEGGNPVKLTSKEAREPVFSPDGKMIAYAADRGIGRGEGNLGLWVVPSGGGTPLLVANAIKATSPIWSPDGKMIAYIDEGQPRMFIVRVNNSGQAIGDPVSIEAPGGTAFIKYLAGWTPDNKIGVLLVTEQESAIYTLPVQGGQAAMIQRTLGGFISQPRWSPDGKKVYYSAPPAEVNSEGVPAKWSILASVPASGGKGGPVPGDINNKNLRLGNYSGGNRISPDGKTMVALAWRPEDLSSEYFYPMARIWKIALDGTESTQITKTRGPFLDSNPCWSPDGKKIAFIRHKLIKGKSNDSMGNVCLYIVNSSGGEPELLDSIPADKSIFSAVWSPDGDKIACFVRKKEPPWSTSHIYIFNMENRRATTVGEIQNGIYSGHCELAWSPDSKRIAFNFNDDSNHGIKIMTLSDGSIEEIKTGLSDLDDIVHFDWSPDGKRFVFCGWKNGKKEFCFLQDFLPLDKLPHEPAKIEDDKSDAITIRQVWSGEDTDNCGTVSPNGELLSFMDGETGNLAIRKLSSGKNVLLTSEGSWDDPMHFALNNVISHDGKRIAYSWYNERGTYDLKIIDLEDKVSSTVYASDSLEEIYPVAWSLADDTIIVQRFLPVNNSYNWQLSYLNPLNGQLFPIKEFQTSFMTNLALASDDTYMAYDFPNPDHQGRFDINMIESHSGKDIPLVQHPANDRVLGWIPETDKFLFTSDRSGTTDIYAITVPGSEYNASPKRIVVNIGQIDPMGFTEKGFLYYSLAEQKFESFLAQIDPVKGEIVDNPKTPLLGSLGDVCWLPDGESMICVKLSQGPDNRPDYTLCHLNLQTGELRDLANQIKVNGMPRVSPDLKSILFYGIDKTSLDEEVIRRGLYIADMKTGSAEFLQVKEDASRSYSAEWDAEGTSVFYTSNGRIIRHYLGTGQEEVIYENPLLYFPTLRRSNDGEHLILDLQATEEEKHLISIPVNGGEQKVICKIHASGTPLMYKKIAISPEGDYIYYTLKGPESGSVIWRIPSSGGQAEKFWYSKNRITGISFHPDGKRVAISVYRRNLEIRVLENLFAELNKAYNSDE